MDDSSQTALGRATLPATEGGRESTRGELSPLILGC